MKPRAATPRPTRRRAAIARGSCSTSRTTRQRAAGRGAGAQPLGPAHRLPSRPARRASSAARLLQPDAILIDLQLPDFDGFEVLRRLRAQPETAATPCIALSANAMPEDIERGLQAGFSDYWTKPINFKTFLSSLEKLFPAVTLRQDL